MRSPRRVLADDRGNAIIEFVFVAVIVMVPLVYFVVCVADVQRSSLAVGQAAREAGRGFATGRSTPDGLRRAAVAARLALDDQGVAGVPDVSFHAGAGCSSPEVMPTLAPGAEYTVCVTRSVAIPGVPSILAGGGVRTIGRYLLHVDDFRAGP
jgi:hypothetical protein